MFEQLIKSLMKLTEAQRITLEKDLRLDSSYGLMADKAVPILNCWHFSSDGTNIDYVFHDREDFLAGMNRVYVLSKKYNIIILAFVLMDTHFHFVLHGELNECQRFCHDFQRQTSQFIMVRHGERKKLFRVPVQHQIVRDAFYLKTVICYVIKNPPVGGLKANYYDYPWSSGSLYFRSHNEWTSSLWTSIIDTSKTSHAIGTRKLITTISDYGDFVLPDGIVFPGDYVAYQEVEQLFRSHKSFNYFICKAKESEIESNGGIISRLSLPIQELRQRRIEICQEFFDGRPVQGLTMEERLLLARTLKSRFHCSQKSIAKACCLKYDEIKTLL